MEQIINYFLQPQNGILGVIIALLIGVIVWQQRRLDSKDKQVTELQGQRISDSQTYTQKYVDVTKEVVGATKDSVNTINLLQRSVDTMAQAFQAFMNGSGKK